MMTPKMFPDTMLPDGRPDQDVNWEALPHNKVSLSLSQHDRMSGIAEYPLFIQIFNRTHFNPNKPEGRV